MFAALLFLAGALGLASDPALLRETIRVPMRDGVRLAANLFRPSKAGRHPVILIRTPYNKGTDLVRSYRAFVEAGYAVVVQDVRGRFESEGVFDPYRQETADGEDTIDWIGKQSWSDGRIGMAGSSYLGIVQWKAALSGHPKLKAIFPVVSGCDDYRDRAYSPGGALKLGNRLLWISANLRAPGYQPPDFSQLVRRLPLAASGQAAAGQTVAMFETALQHPAYDAFWRSISTCEQIANVRVPVFSVGGWYDNFVESDLEAFSRLRKLGRRIHTLIGPWPHNMSIPFADMDFGPQSRVPLLEIQLAWFDRWLRDKPGKANFAPLKIFVMGINRWREENEWPPARARFVKWYLSSRKGANSLAGDGVLLRNPPRRQGRDEYVYDPADPVPTLGGNTCCNPKVFPWGPMDQRPVEKRTDVLVYTSAVLKKDVEVTGPVSAVLWVATTARDTDFTAKLVDVYPDGRAINLADGVLRVRYRDGLDLPAPAEPGKIYAITVPVGVTSNVFRAGHRIRLEISSSNFPRFDRNLNTGGANGYEHRWVRARQSVYHGGERSSYVLLPVVP